MSVDDHEPPGPITILDIVRLECGELESYTGEHFERAGRPMLSGCESCGAALGPWNAHPSRSGYVRCGDCLAPGQGFATVADLLTFEEATRQRAKRARG